MSIRVKDQIVALTHAEAFDLLVELKRWLEPQLSPVPQPRFVPTLPWTWPWQIGPVPGDIPIYPGPTCAINSDLAPMECSIETTYKFPQVQRSQP